MLWPKFDSPDAGRKIAFTGGIKDEIMDIEELAYFLIGFLKKNYPERLIERYKLSESDLNEDDWDIVIKIGKKRGCIISGGETDTHRASALILDEFRSAKLGRIFARNARIICTTDGRELSQGKIRLYSFAVFKYYDIIIVFWRICYFVKPNKYAHGGVLGTPDDLRQ